MQIFIQKDFYQFLFLTLLIAIPNCCRHLWDLPCIAVRDHSASFFSIQYSFDQFFFFIQQSYFYLFKRRQSMTLLFSLNVKDIVTRKFMYVYIKMVKTCVVKQEKKLKAAKQAVLRLYLVKSEILYISFSLKLTQFGARAKKILLL